MERRRFLAAAPALAMGLEAGLRLPMVAPVDPRTRTRFALNLEMWLGGMPFIEKVKKAAAMGFPAVEFWPWQGKPLDELVRVTKETGIEVAQFTGWGFAPGLNDEANHEAFESGIRESCAAARKVSARKMCVLAGQDLPGRTKEQMHEAVIKGLKRVKGMVETEGVMLILEPLNTRVDHRGYCLSTSADAIAICREVASPMVKINWDLYHQQITEGDLCGHLREGISEIGYVQVADHPGRNEPGTGEVCFNRVFKELQTLGYKDYVGLECSPRDGDEEAVERVRAADVW